MKNVAFIFVNIYIAWHLFLLQVTGAFQHEHLFHLRKSDHTATGAASFRQTPGQSALHQLYDKQSSQLQDMRYMRRQNRSGS